MRDVMVWEIRSSTFASDISSCWFASCNPPSLSRARYFPNFPGSLRNTHHPQICCTRGWRRSYLPLAWTPVSGASTGASARRGGARLPVVFREVRSYVAQESRRVIEPVRRKGCQSRAGRHVLIKLWRRNRIRQEVPSAAARFTPSMQVFAQRSPIERLLFKAKSTARIFFADVYHYFSFFEMKGFNEKVC
jgi:hypothetical protein